MVEPEWVRVNELQGAGTEGLPLVAVHRSIFLALLATELATDQCSVLVQIDLLAD